MNGHTSRDRKLVRTLAIGAALLAATLGGMQAAAADVLRPNMDSGGAGGGGAAVIVPEFAQTANGRSIALIESTFAPGGELAGWDDIDVAQNQNERSIALIEGTFAPGGVLAGGDAASGEVAYGPVAFGSDADVNQCWSCIDFA